MHSKDSSESPIEVEKQVPPWHEKPYDGFYPPNYTQIPDDFFDRVMPYLTGSELKVLLYIMRRTFGFKRAASAISLAQIGSGLKSYNGGAGLSKSTVADALNRLEEYGLIVRERSVSDKGDPERTIYSVRLRGAPG